MSEVLIQYGITVPTEILPTGINLEKFNTTKETDFKIMHDISAERPVLVHVGRVAYEKNIAFLLQVVAAIKRKIPDILFVIAGEGPAEKNLRRLARRLGLENNVLFVGYLRDQAALNGCYRAADLFIFASQTETQGLVLLEAMALGGPVLSTAHMGTRDILLNNGAGAWVTKDNVDVFAADAIKLLQNKGARDKLGKDGRRYAESWSVPTLTEELIGIYGQLTENCAKIEKQATAIKLAAAQGK